MFSHNTFKSKNAALRFCWTSLIGLLLLCSSSAELCAYRDGFVYVHFDNNQEHYLNRVDMTSGESEYVAELVAPEGSRIGSKMVIDGENDLLCMLNHSLDDLNTHYLLVLQLPAATVLRNIELSVTTVHEMFVNPQDGLIYAVVKLPNIYGLKIVSINALTGEIEIYADLPDGVAPSSCSYVFDEYNGHLHIIDRYALDEGRAQMIVFDMVSPEISRTYVLPMQPFYPKFSPTDNRFYAFTDEFHNTDNNDPGPLMIIDPVLGVIEKVVPVSGSFESQFGISNWCGIGLNTFDNSYLYAYGRIHEFGGGFVSIRLGEEPGVFVIPYELFDENDENTPSIKGYAMYPTVRNNPKEYYRLEGTLTAESNFNCAKDADDWQPRRLRLNVAPTGQSLSAAPDGRFVAYLESGKYQLSVANQEDWELNCTDGKPTYDFSITDSDLNNQRLFVKPARFFRQLDLSVLSSRPPILGREIVYLVECVNTGTMPYTGAVKLYYDAGLEFLNSSPHESNAEVGELEWQIENLLPGRSLVFRVRFDVGRAEELRGETICVRVERDRPRDDLLTRRDTDEACAQVRGSYDPNDIAVSPAGIGTQGSILAEDLTSTYTIRFQNIGDAPAFDVIIRDTLDRDMDLSSILFGASLHDYTVNVLNKNILEFRFEDIQLPGKAEDEPNSHGAVKYKINLKNDLPGGTQIHNRAAIYFDFNKPVITNTVVNTIGSVVTDLVDYDTRGLLADKLELRSLGQGRFVCRLTPNHSSQSQPQASQPLSGKLQVFSVLGSKVFETSLSGETEVSVDLGSQPSGRYLIRLENAGMTYFGSVAVLRG